MERLNPLSDVVFSNIFRDMSAAPAMLSFINAVLEAAGDGRIQQIIDMRSQYTMIAELIGKKSGRVDVRADAGDRQIFDTEVQLTAGLEMNERDVFYTGKMLGDNLPEGAPYSQLPRVRVINLLNYVIRRGSPVYLQPVDLMYRIPRPDGGMEVATDAIRIYHVQLPLFREQHPTLESVKDDPLGLWLYAFDRGYRSEEEMEVLAAMTEGMGTFAKKYNLALNDPRVRALYEYEMSAKMDEATRLSNARTEGIGIGRAEGIGIGRAEGMENQAKLTALNMRRQLGIEDPDTVARLISVEVGTVKRWFMENPK